MSENLSLNGSKSNFAFTRALVFSLGKPGSNWFKATVGETLVMVFFPDDQSITRDMIEPGDTIYIAGLQDMEVRGSCHKKASCAAFVLQIDAYKNAVRSRQQSKQLEIAEPAAPAEEQVPEVKACPKIVAEVDEMKFCGKVIGEENVRYVKSKKEKYAKRGRHWQMHAINEIVELARRGEVK